jgi:hypothetical protein
VSAERCTRAAAQRSADKAACAAAHGVSCRGAGAAAERAADDGARAFPPVRRDCAASTAADCTANNRTRPATYGTAEGCAGYAAKRAAKRVVHIASRRRQRCSGTERRNRNYLNDLLRHTRALSVLWAARSIPSDRKAFVIQRFNCGKKRNKLPAALPGLGAMLPHAVRPKPLGSRYRLAWDKIDFSDLRQLRLLCDLHELRDDRRA